MDDQPSNESISCEAGIPVADVERYKSGMSLRPNGTWLVSFSFDMPKPLRKKFTGSFTLILHAEVKSPKKSGSQMAQSIRTASNDLLVALREVSRLLDEGRVGSLEWRVANERQLAAERELAFALM